MKYSMKIYIFLGTIFILSVGLSILVPINELYKDIASIPAVASLVGALFQIFRDQAEFEKMRFLQQQEQIFNLGATSHMANIAFDKHVEFCEKYIKEVDLTVSELFSKGLTKDVNTHLSNLIEIKNEYSVWISHDIGSQLVPFEKALNTLRKFSEDKDSSEFSENLSGMKALKKTYDVFREILNLQQDPGFEEDSEISAEIVRKKIRSILGVEELSKIRKTLMDRALKYIEIST